MAKIKISSRENTPPSYTRESTIASQWRDKFSEGDLETQVYHYHLAGPHQPALLEIVVQPDGELSPHGHKGDEILYVLEGEMHLGKRVLGLGASVHIPAMTAYLIKAGPTGLRFLNFWSEADGIAYFHRDDLIKMRGSADSVASPEIVEG
jgi:quercetin dioxygenase-like cupin family protein